LVNWQPINKPRIGSCARTKNQKIQEKLFLFLYYLVLTQSNYNY